MPKTEFHYRYVPEGSNWTIRFFVDDAAMVELELGFASLDKIHDFADLIGRSNIIASVMRDHINTRG